MAKTSGHRRNQHVGLTGDLKNPDVAFRPLSGISRGLSATMEKILKAPVRIIEPFIPREKEETCTD